MSIPGNKTELIKEINATYAKLRADFLNIPDELTYTEELDGHAKNSQMSICNLVSYLIGWGNLVLKWDNIKSEGKNPDLPETGYKWNELGKLAQKFYVDYQSDDYQALLIKLDTVVKNILKLIEKYDNHQLYEIAWYEKWTLGRIIQLNTSSPYKNARARICRWKKEKGLK